MTIFAAILAGGSGSRMNSDLPKQFLLIKEKPVIVHTINQFDSHPLIDEIIIVVPSEYEKLMNEIFQKYPVIKKIIITKGGSTRQLSSYNALMSCAGKDDDIILLHDAARPFVSHKIISDCIDASQQYGACSVYIPAVDTITEIKNDTVISIPPRENLYYTQTPQAFQLGIIKSAHKKSNDNESTDDVSLVLKSNKDVHKIEGDPKNIKITSPFDMEIASLIIENL